MDTPLPETPSIKDVAEIYCGSKLITTRREGETDEEWKQRAVEEWLANAKGFYWALLAVGPGLVDKSPWERTIV
jgi:hypothetical protein